MIELVDKDNKTVNIIIFQMCNKVEGKMNILRKAMNDIKKVSNWISSSIKYLIVKIYTGWD